MSASARLCALGVLLLLALQVAWHAWWLPPEPGKTGIVVLLACAPLLPALLLLLARSRNFRFWAGVAALLYFCHGITEAWTVAPARPLALAEIALSLWVIFSGNWDGIKARRDKRRPPPANV